MSSAPQTTGRPGAGRTAPTGVRLRRLAFLIPGGIALLLGLDAALLLLGLPAPITFDRLSSLHAPLMVFGFIGTLVVLERAVAARRWWAFIAPAALGLGALTLLSPLPPVVGKTGLVLGLAVLVLVYRLVWSRQPSVAVAIQTLGAFAGLTATILWLAGVAIPPLTPAMAAFLVLTIAGERLELARLSPTVDARAERSALACGVLLVAASVLAPMWSEFGYAIFGAALLLLVGWLARYDVAARLIHTRGLPRYMAACLLVGYLWLVVAAAVWLLAGEVNTGPAYDAVLHAVFLGFVMSMVMAHAPVILPAVIRTPLPYRWYLYIPVGLLHTSLLLRLLAGDAWGYPVMVQLGGALNMAAVLLFVVCAVGSAIAGPPATRETANGRSTETREGRR